jgi:hypothetical protein
MDGQRQRKGKRKVDNLVEDHGSIGNRLLVEAHCGVVESELRGDQNVPLLPLALSKHSPLHALDDSILTESHLERLVARPVKLLHTLLALLVQPGLCPNLPSGHKIEIGAARGTHATISCLH